jgi:hypothetical protein
MLPSLKRADGPARRDHTPSAAADAGLMVVVPDLVKGELRLIQLGN